MVEYTDSLVEMRNLAKSQKRESMLYISQHEGIPLGSTSLSDEDTETDVRLKLKLLLETNGKSLCFSQQYDDEDLYEEDLKLIDQMRETIPYKLVSDSEIEERIH